MMTSNYIGKETFSIKILICKKINKNRFYCKCILFCKFMPNDIVKNLMTGRNDFPDFIKFISNPILGIKSIISMGKDTIFLTLTNIEYSFISWIYQAIDIILQFFLCFLRELGYFHNIIYFPVPKNNVVINTESVGRITHFS